MKDRWTRVLLVAVIAFVGIAACAGSGDDEDGDGTPDILQGDLNVERPALTSIADDGVDNLGTLDTGVATSFTWTLRNVGLASLTLPATSATTSATTNCAATVTTQPATTLATAATTTVVIDVTPTADGAFDFTLSIESNDPDEDPYTIEVSGAGATPAPEINVERPANITIADGGTEALGTVLIGMNNDYTYTIRNEGDATLTLGGAPVATSAQVNCTAVVQTAVGSTTINGGATTSFVIRVNVTAVGAFSFTLTVNSDDADEATYDFVVSGTGTQNAPEIEVQFPAGVAIGDGGSLGLGTVTYQVNQNLIFTVRNFGTTDLTFGATPAATSAPTNVTASITDQPATITAGGTDTFTAQYNVTGSGYFEFTVTVDSNDGDEDPYTLTVSGLGQSQTQTISIAPTTTITAAAGIHEIPAFDPLSDRLFVANGTSLRVDVYDISNVAVPVTLAPIDCSPYATGGGSPNSVAIFNGILAIAIQSNPTQTIGQVAFFNCATLAFVAAVDVGALPDMVAWTPNGARVLVCNEGEPALNYTSDPNGSISIITIPGGGVAALTNGDVTTADFTSFVGTEAALRASGVRIFGTDGVTPSTVAQDMEPEYLTFSPDSATAWVTCQENNAIAQLTIATATITNIYPLGVKNHAAPGNEMDSADQNNPPLPRIQFCNWPIQGLYLPDAIKSYTVGGTTYLVTANEGDQREWGTVNEDTALNAVTLDTTGYDADVTFLQNNAIAGRLRVSTYAGAQTDGDAAIEVIQSFGARSFSIWTTGGVLVWDSGDQFERRNAQNFPANFNCDHGGTTIDNRSDNKGPEPEGVEIAQIGDRFFAFIVCERTSSIMVYDITNPLAPVYVQEANNRTFGSGGNDAGPEASVYVSAANSPTGLPLLIVSNEVSGTTTIWTITVTNN
ncbi:MAG: choice-of-anchor I family protein [Planctomycetes bacterium]|nr:choice-of-anchor I family protein [Planctomycetota bacterium]